LDKKFISVTIIALLVFSVAFFPQLSYCQTDTPMPTDEAPQDSGLDLTLIIAIVVVVAVAVGGASAFMLLKRRKVNEKNLRKFSPSAFEEYVLGKFNGTPSDPTTGVTGFTQGGQPLLIKQSDNVSLAEVEDFVKVLVKGKTQKGTVVAFGFEKDAIEAKITAMDNEIELQLLRIYELINKRYAKRIADLASASVTFNATVAETTPLNVSASTIRLAAFDDFDTMPPESPRVGVKPRVFVSNSNSQVSDQVKRMLDFLHYEYAMGDKEETSVPISDKNLNLMKNCDCAVINIAAAEQERRYSGLYILNSNVTSAINAAYLKYDAQVVLLVERKIELPSNLKGLRRIEYDSDELSFNAAMDLEKILAEFKRI
jgi:hypothetical protein